MDADTKWRTRFRFVAALFALLIHVVTGYEEIYTISHLSPKSSINNRGPDIVLQTSQTENLDFNIDNTKYDAVGENERVTDDIIEKEEGKQEHLIIEKSAEPNRESRSINIDEIPMSNNNEIDSEIELLNKRKYYDIRPTKPIDYLKTRDEDEILTSEGFGDRLDFRFPGEANRVPKARALNPLGPKIRPTAVQPIFATATPREQPRQNTEIQNIITGLVKLLNGNVNVQANSQLLNGRPSRPMASRINNRGPPRISDVPLIPEFDKPVTPPAHAFHPTKTPPPYPFDRPPHLGVNLPEQIVPPLSHRPGLYRPMPPWQRPRPPPRIPSRRPNPGLPVYKPMPPIPSDLPDLDDSKTEDELTFTENESNHENNIHHDDKDSNLDTNKDDKLEDNNKDIPSPTTTPEVNTTSEEEKPTTEVTSTSTTTSTEPTTSTSTTSTTTTEKPTTTTEKETTTTEKATTTEKVTTTSEKSKTEKPLKPEKKKDSEKDKFNKEKEKLIKPLEEKPVNKTKTDIDTNTAIQSSIVETKTSSLLTEATPTPTEGLISHAPSVVKSSSPTEIIKTSSINTQPLPTSQGIPYHPYRPRPGIVLDDPDFKPNSRHEIPVPVLTAPERIPTFGEIFDVTVSAIQGPGEKGGASVHIENVNPLSGHADHDDIIVTASGDQGFVSIDGKRTYLNLFDSSTTAVRPTRVQSLQQSVPPLSPPPLASIGTGVAIPSDEVPPPPRRPPTLTHGSHGHRPPGYRRPQPTVRIDTCIVGDDSTCDQAQNEKCRTEAGISSCGCRPGYARRTHRDPCRRVVALILNLRVDRLYDRKVVWDNKLADKESEPYQQLSYEALRAIDSAFSMTPFSDDFVSGTVNSIHQGDQHNQGVFINYTILMQETPETMISRVGVDIQKHLLGVIRRRSNNVGASALWVASPAGSVPPPADLDECSSPDLNDCHELATCSNIWGGFRCACPDTTLDVSTNGRNGRQCQACASSHCSERGVCRYTNGQPYCSCNSGYYGSTCEVDGEVVGVAVGASLAAALVIAVTLAALLSWSRKWSREQKAVGMGSPVFSYMAANTIKTPPVGQPPYQVTLEERMRWAQIAEAMAQANHYASVQQPEATIATRPSSAMFGGYPTLPPVPMPRMGLHGPHHNGTLNTVTSRANTSASHHNLYGYTNHMATESTSSEASSHVQERADLLVPRPKSRASRSMHNQTGIYYDVEYENAPEGIYGTKGIPMSTYTISRGPPFYRT